MEGGVIIKKIEEDLIQSTLDSLSANIAILDKNGVIQFVNKAWSSFALNNGLSLENCCEGINYLKVLKNSDAENNKDIAGAIREVINGKNDVFTFEYPCHSPDEKRWYNMRITPFIGDSKDYAAVIAHENITELQFQRLKAKAEKDFNNNILNNLSEIIIYLAGDFTVKWANQTALNENNIKLKEIKGEKCFGKWFFEAEICKKILIKAKKSKEIKEKIIRKDNGKIWKMKVIPDFNEEREVIGFIIAALDITKEKLAEQKIKQVANKLEEQFEKAGKLHDQFLPSSMPKLKDLTIAAYYSPAERIGGDFYNFIKLDKELIFYISDVSGHDLSGSMLNIFLKETINSYLISKKIFKNSEALDPAKILNYLNKRYNEESFPDSYFICLLIGVIDLESKKIRFSNAGIHFSPLLIKSDGGISSFPCGGMPISFVSEGIYDVCNFDLQPGESFFINTDGLLEQTNKVEIYGQNRLVKLLSEKGELAPAEIIENIYADFNKFKGDNPVQDDLTYLLIRHNSK